MGNSNASQAEQSIDDDKKLNCQPQSRQLVSLSPNLKDALTEKELI